MTAKFDYKRAQTTAKRLIKRFGGEVVLKVKSAGGTSYDPTISEDRFDAIAAIVDYKTTERDGTLIKSTDKKAYLSTEGLEVVPNVADTLETEGATFQIISVMPLQPDPTNLVVFWKLQVRN